MTDAQNMEEVKPTRPWRYRLIFVVVILGLHGLFAFIPQLLEAFGVAKLDIWFRDTYAMLAASDSAQAGFDPFVENLYDLIQERHIYSDWWYALGKLGLDSRGIQLSSKSSPRPKARRKVRVSRGVDTIAPSAPELARA